MATVIREELDIYQRCASPLYEEGGGVLPVCLSLKCRRFVVGELLPPSDFRYFIVTVPLMLI